ncbi:MAG: sodium:solute symporter [Planctomycetaceae bacterium]
MPDVLAATDFTNGYEAISALVLLIVACLYLGVLANRAISKSAFLSGYFLGNRGLGAWALALTATVQSGGTFLGYPSFVYTHGWVVLLWIGSYMMVPLTGFALMGKRVGQLSRRSGAITVPDLFRARFDSPSVGVAASLLIIVFLMFTTIAQFKAGGVVLKSALPGVNPLEFVEGTDKWYYVGLAIFTLTVVVYTVVGGFLASVWTDLFQSVLMAIGTVILLFLALQHAGGLETATRASLERLGPAYATGPGLPVDPGDPPFMTISMSVGAFLLWILAGAGNPAGIVRLMASKSTATFRRSIVLLSVYNLMIYIPLAIVCICARSVLPDLPKGHFDEVIPRMALYCSNDAPGGTFLAGLILTAPFGAVMASVSTFLVVIASGLVHDVYQRIINPQASTHTLRMMTYFVTFLVGALALAANIRPVVHLQSLVVIAGSGIASTFLVPALMACYWRRATAAGTLTAMLTGAGTVLLMLVIGWMSTAPGKAAKPYLLLHMDPIIWGVLASAIAGIAVSLLTRPPAESLVSKLFDAPAAP